MQEEGDVVRIEGCLIDVDYVLEGESTTIRATIKSSGGRPTRSSIGSSAPTSTSSRTGELGRRTCAASSCWRAGGDCP